MKLRAAYIIAILAMLLCGLMIPAGVACADSSPILLLSGNTQDDEVVVTATLRDNNGISAMLLSLDYDTERLELKGISRGSALASLDLVTTNVEGPQGYAVYPFVLSWMGDANDASNGVLLTMRFRVKEGASGQANVTFSYTSGRDVNRYEKGELKPVKLLTDILHIDLDKGKATSIESEETYRYNKAKDEAYKKGVTIGLSVGVPIMVALIVLVPLFIVRRRINNN